jgi:hypothetical protein
MTTFMAKILTACRSRLAPYVAGTLVVLVVLFLLLHAACPGQSNPPAPAPPAAEERHETAVAAKGEAMAYHKVKVAQDPALQAAREETARVKAALAQALLALQQAAPGPAHVGAEAQALEECLETTQAQDRKADLLEAQLGTVTAEAEASTRAAAGFEQEAAALRKAIQPARPTAVGGIWNPSDQTYGLFLERDVWRLRVGVDLVQQRAPILAGGAVHVTTQVRFGFTF